MKQKRLVILESPFAGSSPEDRLANKWYAREALHHALLHGDAPIASHILYTTVLDDNVPGERSLGMEAGLSWCHVADATVVYTDRGISPGMKLGIQVAERAGRPVGYRSIQHHCMIGNCNPRPCQCKCDLCGSYTDGRLGGQQIDRDPDPVSARRDRVTSFHRRVGQHVPAPFVPAVPSDDVVRFRLSLMAEEFLEILEAASGDMGHFPEIKKYLTHHIKHTAIEVDFPEFVDGLCDLDYVVEGARIAFGVNGEPVEKIVHAANIAKRGGGLDENGKAMKPKGWIPPDIRAELIRQGWQAPPDEEVT